MSPSGHVAMGRHRRGPRAQRSAHINRWSKQEQVMFQDLWWEATCQCTFVVCAGDRLSQCTSKNCHLATGLVPDGYPKLMNFISTMTATATLTIPFIPQTKKKPQTEHKVYFGLDLNFLFLLHNFWGQRYLCLGPGRSSAGPSQENWLPAEEGEIHHNAGVLNKVFSKFSEEK